MSATFDGAAAPNSAMTREGRKDRSIDELIGLSRGILANGIIDKEEADYLLEWLELNREFADFFPFNVLYPRVYEMLSDDILDTEEEGELMTMLLALQGGTLKEHNNQAISESTTLPLCQPAPEITFTDKLFVVTGHFASGSRKVVTAEIESCGGIVKKDITKKTDYLVIGEVGSRDWKHSSFGRKIEKAVSNREQGCPISVISEEHWLKHIS